MTGTRLVVLKSPDFGGHADTHDGALPYRVDRLRALGFDPVWDDRRARLTGRRARLVGRLEALTTPFLQTWHLRRKIRDAPATLAFFESEGHGLALARAIGLRRRPVLVVMSCWLGEIVPRLGPVRRRLYRWMYRRVDAVTVFSANQIPTLCAGLALDPAKVRTIPFGIDTEEVTAHPPTRGAYLLAVGRDAGRDWPTLFAGVAGTGRRVFVLARPGRLPVTEPPPEIEVLGYVDRDRYLDLLAGCAGVLVVTGDLAYPSGQTVLLEALALGKRCIVTDTPAMRTFGGDLPCRWVRLGDASALKAAIVHLDEQPAPDVSRERLDAAAMWSAVADLLRERIVARG